MGSRHRLIGGAAVTVAALVVGLASAVLWWSGAQLVGDQIGLARVELQPLAGSLVSARAFGPRRTPIHLLVRGRRLQPTVSLAPGEMVTVIVVVRRPGWLHWLLGQSRTERLRVRAPTINLHERWLTSNRRGTVTLRFDEPVDRLAYRDGSRQTTVSASGTQTVTLRVHGAAGTLEVASAARSWERLGSPARVTWFPASRLPVVLAEPSRGAPIAPRTPITLTFSQPLATALGSVRPHFASAVPGEWSAPDTHTLRFTPRGFGYPFATALRLRFPRRVSVSDDGSSPAASETAAWTVAGAEFVRLQQLLADAGYLPLGFHERGGQTVAQQAAAEVAAAVAPPSGTFAWRYPNTPPELQRLWQPGRPNQITRGAVMMFEHDHGLAVDGVAGAQVWHALLLDAIEGKTRTDGYSYVYVHRSVPQLLTLWHNGHVVLTSPGNTGVPSAPTKLGTFPVFEHIPVGTMSGTNPDGSHYHDPGIRWISYFNGGDALHAFNRASFGTPQSLGCVELPLPTAAKVWPYTPIGTLVTIEN
jgi:hypothetical protein